MRRARLLKKLQDREFRRAFAEEAVDVGIPVQIREMRRARRWTQRQLGDAAGIAQEAVARAERMNYGRFTLATLKNLAAAFDCALIVRFAPFSELISWKERIDAATITPADYASDNVIHGALAEPNIQVGVPPSFENVVRPRALYKPQDSTTPTPSMSLKPVFSESKTLRALLWRGNA